jgi:AhpD family alkylhydroperoxidase
VVAIARSPSRFRSLFRQEGMLRVQPRSAASAGLLVKLTFWFARRRLGKVPAPVGIMAHNGWVLAAVAGYELAQERAHAAPARLKDIANLKVAMEVGCRFCIDIGSAVAARGGLREEELRDLPDYQASPHFSQLEKRVLDYAVCMCRAPMAVAPELTAELREQLGVPALVELTAAIAWENYRARFNHAFGAEEEGFSEGSFCLLEARGHDEAGGVARPAAQGGAAS